MSKIGNVLAFLRESGDYVSGDYISSRLSISRTAVWKYMKQLEQFGYTFTTYKGRGYRLEGTPDRLYPWEIERHLHTECLGREVVYKDSVDSTNALAFTLALTDKPEGTCVVAETQTAGRGRLQRQWFSPYGKNLYLSVIIRPGLHPSHVYPITFLSSLAVYDTLEAFGIEPNLKWPNDVLVNGKKICGTLLELSTELDAVRFVVIGIGLNINLSTAEMTGEIQSRATSLFLETKKFFERARVCGMLLDNLEKYYSLGMIEGMDRISAIWEERALIRGKYMEIVQMENTYKGVSEGIDTDGALLLKDNGKVTRIIAGDVSL